MQDQPQAGKADEAAPHKHLEPASGTDVELPCKAADTESRVQSVQLAPWREKATAGTGPSHTAAQRNTKVGVAVVLLVILRGLGR